MKVISKVYSVQMGFGRDCLPSFKWRFTLPLCEIPKLICFASQTEWKLGWVEVFKRFTFDLRVV